MALLVFRRTLPDAPRPFPTPGYPWVPLLFTLAGAGIVLNIFFTDTRNALIGTAIFAAGRAGVLPLAGAAGGGA